LLIADFLKGWADAPLLCVDENLSPQRLMGSISNILGFALLASDPVELIQKNSLCELSQKKGHE